MATKKPQSELAKAQAGTPGKEAAAGIANSVVDRIVANSTPQFQDFLSRTGNGSATDAARSFVASAPQPVPQMQAPQPPVLANQYAAPVAPMGLAGMPSPPMLGIVPQGPMADLAQREMMLRVLGLI